MWLIAGWAEDHGMQKPRGQGLLHSGRWPLGPVGEGKPLPCNQMVGAVMRGGQALPNQVEVHSAAV